MRACLLASVWLASSAALAQTPAVTVDHAWARATAPGLAVGGAFLTLTDHGPADRLVSAATPVAAMAEVHETTMEGGIMRMRPVAAIPLPAGEPVTLKPGGYHIMLMGLRQPLKQGDRFPLTLTFGAAAPVTTEVVVAGPGATGP